MPEVSIDAKQVARIARTVRRASPEAWKVCRVGMRAVGDEVAKGMRARTSYSKRITRSIKVRTTASGNVKITYGGEGAPDAVPIENKGRGFVRHKVFGHDDRWTDKNSRPPFALPEFAQKRDWALGELERLYMDAFERIWGGE